MNKFLVTVASAILLFGATFTADGASSRGSSGGFSSSRSSSSSGGFSSSKSSTYKSPSSSSSSSSSSGGFSSSTKSAIGGAAIGAGVGAAATSSHSESSNSSSTNKSSGGFSSGTSKPTSVPSYPSAAPKSDYNTYVNRDNSSKAYDRGLITGPRVAQPSSPSYKPTHSNTYSRDEINRSRTTYYTTVYRDRYIPAPVGTYYGNFSEMFMWAMMYDAMFAYSHRNSAEYLAWRRDAELRAQHDAKVAAQLKELDSKVAELKEQNVAVEANYMPKNVPQEVVYKDEVLERPSSHWFLWLLTIAVVLGSIGFIVHSRRKANMYG